MTRVLSELLGVPRLEFSKGLASLERASGSTSADIKLTTEIHQATMKKLKALGLDPHDTDGPELYHALEQRLKDDEVRLIQKLREKHSGRDAGDDVAHIVAEINSLPLNKAGFGLKTAAARGLLKKNPPKQAMKSLGYRSLDSMLKREEVAAIYAACRMKESATWHKKFYDKYKNLTASDFETRPIEVHHPTSAAWRKLAESHVAKKRHNILTFGELGAVVLLPLPDKRPPGAAFVCLLLALHAMNELKAASTYLKLCQVKPDFGKLVQSSAMGNLTIEADLFGRPVSWQVIQRYYARFADKYRPELFEPHVQAEDLYWHSIEKVVSYIDPRLEFWLGTNHLSLLHDHQPVSLNIIDAALNYCNGLKFEQRLSHYLQRSLWHELVIRYLKHDNVEHLVMKNFELELAAEPEFV